jgi:N-acetylglucosamine-6-phosphate deacetylase
MSKQNDPTPEGAILTPRGWVSGKVEFSGARISAISGEARPAGARAPGPFLIPGFIDLHVHGGAGEDWQSEEEGVRAFVRYHTSQGTTAIAPTSATGPLPAIEKSLGIIARMVGQRGKGEAVTLGAHLEGPFVNPRKPGAMEVSQIIDGDPEMTRRWLSQHKIIVSTVAPEAPNGLEVMRIFAEAGCRPQIGHSVATPEICAEAFDHGCAGFTHLFNAMSQTEHRAPGVAAYALAKAEYAEIICDLVHVDPTVLLAAYRAIPRLYAITDASGAAGTPDGTFVRGGRPVVKKGQRITLTNGVTLAGSAVTMLDCFRNLVSLGLTIEQAAEMTSTRQADYLGLSDLGRLKVGVRACMIKFDPELNLLGVWVDGESIAPAA